ncbi:MAG TPA: helix-turn-helix domain-containing protein [Chloroflexota bacterium]|jgi:predicted transcriptional regulator
MSVKPNADSFGTFLDTLQRSSPPPTPSGASLRVLRTLAGVGPRTVPDLAAASGIGFTDLAATLTTLQEAGLVTMQGQPGHEQVEITAHGSEIAALNP